MWKRCQTRCELATTRFETRALGRLAALDAIVTADRAALPPSPSRRGFHQPWFLQPPSRPQNGSHRHPPVAVACLHEDSHVSGARGEQHAQAEALRTTKWPGQCTPAEWQCRSNSCVKTNSISIQPMHKPVVPQGNTSVTLKHPPHVTLTPPLARPSPGRTRADPPSALSLSARSVKW